MSKKGVIYNNIWLQHMWRGRCEEHNFIASFNNRRTQYKLFMNAKEFSPIKHTLQCLLCSSVKLPHLPLCDPTHHLELLVERQSHNSSLHFWIYSKRNKTFVDWSMVTLKSLVVESNNLITSTLAVKFQEDVHKVKKWLTFQKWCQDLFMENKIKLDENQT
jgi:hypothetical protein